MNLENQEGGWENWDEDPGSSKLTKEQIWVLIVMSFLIALFFTITFNLFHLPFLK